MIQYNNNFIPVSPDFNLCFIIHANADADLPCILKASFIVNGKLSHNEKVVNCVVLGLVPQIFFMECPNGSLVSASVDCFGPVGTDYSCFAKISLGNTQDSVYYSILNLTKGYCRTNQPLCYPVLSDTYDDLLSCRWTVLQETPGAGHDVVFTCPPNTYMEVISIRTSLTTNAQVKTRYVQAHINKETSEVSLTGSNYAHTAGLVAQYSISNHLASIVTTSTVYNHFYMCRHRLIGDDNVTISALSLDPGDRFGVSRAMVKLWTMPL